MQRFNESITTLREITDRIFEEVFIEKVGRNPRTNSARSENFLRKLLENSLEAFLKELLKKYLE